MASRYWVGGTGNWSDNTNHWAASSGGSPGASLPTSADDVFFDSSSNGSSYTVTSDVGGLVCRDITFANPLTGSPTLSISNTFQVFGSMTMVSGMTVTNTGSNGITFSATTTGKTLTTNGVDFGSAFLYFNGAGGGWTLQDDLTGTGNSGGMEVDDGTFDANGHNVNFQDAIYSFPGVGQTAVVNMGSGTWSTADWEFDPAGTLTLNAQTSTLKIVSYNPSIGTGDSVFLSHVLTYNNVWVHDLNSGAKLQVQSYGSTYGEFRIEPGLTVAFQQGVTHTFASFVATGTAGNEIVITSIDNLTLSTLAHTLLKTGGGYVDCNYLNLQHSIATPSNTWYAGNNSTNNQATATAGSGWTFLPAPTTTTKTITGVANISSPYGYTDYTRGHASSLPATDAQLATAYNSADIAAVATLDGSYVLQVGAGDYVLHEFKNDVGSATSATLSWSGKCAIATTSQTAHLEIYNRNTTTWDSVATDSATAANTDFTLGGVVASLTNYKDGSNIIACRVYQHA